MLYKIILISGLIFFVGCGNDDLENMTEKSNILQNSDKNLTKSHIQVTRIVNKNSSVQKTESKFPNEEFSENSDPEKEAIDESEINIDRPDTKSQEELASETESGNVQTTDLKSEAELADEMSHRSQVIEK